jgi:hypothetical protein
VRAPPLAAVKIDILIACDRTCRTLLQVTAERGRRLLLVPGYL